MYIPPIEPAAIIPAVSASLRTFICANVPMLPEDSVSLASPAEYENSNENGLSLYLYQIEKNPYLSNLPPTLTLQQGDTGRPASLISTPAPLAVDLLYMMVAYGRTGEYEQMIASGLVNLLDTCGTLPDEYQAPVLRHSGN